MNARLLFTHALSPLHAGTGQGVGVIDLPIAREKATGLPFLPGSSLKGVLRDTCRERMPAMTVSVFGPDTANASGHAGSAQFSDQRLLLLPMRSLAGTFAWVTSPYVLRRLVRDALAAGVNGLPDELPSPAENGCLVCQRACQLHAGDERAVVLEDLELAATPNDAAREWGEWIGEHLFPDDSDWQQMLTARFCVVHDDLFGFLLDTATEITARIRLKEDEKTVAKGGLWYEEALPTESVLYGLLVATPIEAGPNEVFATVADLISKPLQFGGKATVGRGVCRMEMADPTKGGDESC